MSSSAMSRTLLSPSFTTSFMRLTASSLDKTSQSPSHARMSVSTNHIEYVKHKKERGKRAFLTVLRSPFMDTNIWKTSHLKGNERKKKKTV